MFKRRNSNGSNSSKKRRRASFDSAIGRSPAIAQRSVSRRAVGALANLALSATPGNVQRGVRIAQKAYKYYKTYKKGRAAPSFRGGKRGASMSQSKGIFSDEVPNKTKLDKMAKNGVVISLENGHVHSDGRSATYLAHSTLPGLAVFRACVASLIKKIFVMAGYQIKNFEEALLASSDYQSILRLSYKKRDDTDLLVHDFTIVTGVSATTLQSLTRDVEIFFESKQATNTVPLVMLKFALYQDIGVLSTAKVLATELDLTNCRFDVYSKSRFKIQNRTVNSATSDEADNVDNVPIDGKYYEVNSNGTMFRDYSTQVATGTVTAALTTSIIYGTLRMDPLPPSTGTNMYKEVPLSSQIVGCKKTGKAHLDPGDIKTSVMTDTLEISLNQLIQKVYYGSDIAFDLFKQIWFGKTRIFCFEKMIDAVATTSDNAFKVAYEHDLDIGAICNVKKENHTAPRIESLKGSC